MAEMSKKIKFYDPIKIKNINKDTIILFDKYKIDMTIRELSPKSISGYELEMGLEHLKAIGLKKSGEHSFKYKNKKIYPDFVLDKILYENYNINMDKYLYIEYFGFINISSNYLSSQYRDKMKLKIEFFNNNNNLYFIDLYPDDLKNKFKGVRNKINNFINEYISCKVS